MKVTLKYFGVIAESAGKSEEVLELEQGLSLRELKDQQIKTYQIQDAGSVQIAVNQNLNNEVELKEGDEVAFLPPFAGG
ncbi:MoaD/ThiS family protein [Subsaximicrobium wynnwilliamsii]|uniref:Molybdopterin synthase sulfur carrier subunit n=1 Tax=Subsaximicrobium wynnwilliamsii TaxID=291179 RepID=A0A5C6ZG76_9FLAO|nr:MoaD/ThiS family protein [Subsaximicrobium wynnwilliamsii]TXD83168.1 MoaD/ThiS family protein [Subsaximicrobium wynnwilliamsii]TXD88281.1 MoaD/ThiS family protein [Subsaximicrobium wynnwilliamsii]TXE03002.1 MoaD/ThiS family protein [Subsaximicrobium wynnwilliamsii]